MSDERAPIDQAPAAAVTAHDREIVAKPLRSQELVSQELAGRLAEVSGQALDWIENVLQLPIDETNGALLRTQASAVQSALNTQVRANALMLQAQRQDRALDELLAMIRRQESRVPVDRESGGRSLSMG